MAATFMMMKSRRISSQGLFLLLLSLLLLTFSIIPAIRGERKTDGGRTSKGAVMDDDPFNGCQPHNASESNFCCTKNVLLEFCCTKDKLCWPSLYLCAMNCRCKVRCNGATARLPSPSSN